VHRREGFRTSKFAGGAVIAQVAFENRSGVFGHVEDEPEAVEIGFDGSLALLTVAGAALALAILPAAVGLAMLLGTTVPLEFGGAAALAIVACIKLAAGASGIVAAIRAPQPARPATRFD